MTEDVQQMPVRPSYEQVRDTLPHTGARAYWQEAGRLLASTRMKAGSASTTTKSSAKKAGGLRRNG
jgi:hypothetical protein